MATIKDIAKKAGVSVTTVSKVINGYPDIAHKTRERVQEVIRECNYQPNSTARSLSTRESRTIGVFFNYDPGKGIHNIFFQEIIYGLEKALGEKGYDILYFAEHRFRENRKYNYLEKCRDRMIDGTILMGMPLNENLQKLIDSTMPCVLIDLAETGNLTSYVTYSNENGVEKALNYLFRLGHRSIGTITGPLSIKPAYYRQQVFEKVISGLEVNLREEWILEEEFTEQGGDDGIDRLLDLPEIPTALFCQSDAIAIGAIRSLQDKGFEIPEDFSVIGYDDVMISRYLTPGLTTVKQDAYRMGHESAELLLKIINRKRNFDPVILDTELVIRDSCQKYRRQVSTD